MIAKLSTPFSGVKAFAIMGGTQRQVQVRLEGLYSQWSNGFSIVTKDSILYSISNPSRS